MVGGIYIDGGSIDCVDIEIMGNRCLTGGSNGGGLYAYSTELNLENTIVALNQSNWSGGGICMENCYYNNYFKSSVIRNNNIVTGQGGGLYCSGTNTGLEISNTSFYGNTSSVDGGAIHCSSSWMINIENSIIYCNYPDEITDNSGNLIINNSDIRYGYSGVGNINEDPLWVDPDNGDLHLTVDSPCIDAGNPNSPPDPDGTCADMGAYYYPQSFIAGYVTLINGGGNVEEVNIEIDNNVIHPDINGYYIIKVDPGIYDLKASLYAYDYFIKNDIEVISGNTTIVNFDLEHTGRIIVDKNGNGHFTTIQGGIDKTLDGEEVWVVGGVYSDYEDRNLHWADKHITVKSVSGPDGCIIQGEGSGDYLRAFNLSDSGINNSDLIQGFTIRNFEFDQYSGIDKGAVILCENGASPTINNCIIEDCIFDNQGTGSIGLGIGIYCEGNTVIKNCILREITGINIIGGVGIECKGNVQIKNCEICSNTLAYYSNPDVEGIAIYVLVDTETPSIENNIIHHNIIDYYYQGSLIYFEMSEDWNGCVNEMLLVNNQIYQNKAINLIVIPDNIPMNLSGNLIYENNCISSGSAICIGHAPSYSSSDSYTIDNNTIVDNVFDDGFSQPGAAIYLYDSGYYSICNNIIVYNEGYGIYWNTGTERLIVKFSDIFENDIDYDTTPEEYGCIHINPTFTDSTNDDYSLAWNDTLFSPCIDTGHPWVQYNDDDGTPADMGAITTVAHDYFKDDYDNEEFDNVDWMSFPVLNRTTTNWMRADSVLIKQGLMDDDQIYNDDILYQVVFKNDEAVKFDNGWQINLTNDEFDSRQGYKVQLKEQYDNIPVKGISGTRQDESTHITLLANDQENWVGCFLKEPATFIDAFASIWNEWSAVYSEHWAVERPEPGITPEIVFELTANPGELYIIKVYEECDLVWNESDPPVPPKTKEMTDFFSYNETIDYMAVSIDTVYSDTSVVEIAVYSDDQCIGASKVYNDEYPVQILAYTPDTLKSGSNGLEFRLYYNGQKGEYLKSIPYVMFSSEVQAFVEKPLYYERKSFATVQLNSDESSVTHRLMLLQNYPNPVRTNITMIRFMPQQNAHHTELNIYNIRGQLVQTFNCDGIISSGTKDIYYTITWDCRDRYGRDVKNGIYFYKLTSRDKSAVLKMLLMK